ncbi:MAG: hypothetical protein ACOVSW_09615 [Candidatus Kapaibacteriota bacterium]|jgi:hypothetical protein
MNTQFSTSPDQGSPILAREEVEALLPDYAFGNLESAADDKARFEASLPAYPDLVEELRLIQDSFGSIREEFEALNRAESQRLKNLTVHVQQRLQQEAERRAHRFRLLKFFVPALAMCVVLAVISIPQAFNGGWKTFTSDRTETAILTPEDIQRLEELQVDESVVNEHSAFADNLGANANSADEADKQAAMVARKMLTKETLRALAANRSAFQDYFDNSTFDDMSEEEAAGIAAAMTEM